MDNQNSSKTAILVAIITVFGTIAVALINQYTKSRKVIHIDSTNVLHFDSTLTFLYLCPVSGGPGKQQLPTNSEVHIQNISDTGTIYLDWAVKKFIGQRSLKILQEISLENFLYIRSPEHLKEIVNGFNGAYLVGVGEINVDNAMEKSKFLTQSIFKNGFDDYYCKGYRVILK